MWQGNELKLLVEEYVGKYSLQCNLSKSTVKEKIRFFRRLLEFLGEKPLDVMQSNDYLQSLRERGVKPISIQSAGKRIRAYLTYLEKIKKMITSDENFGLGIILPTVHQEVEPLISAELTEEVIIHMTTSGPTDNSWHRERKIKMRFALRFMVRTGLRFNEVTLIKGSDLFLLDDDPKVRVHSKGGKIEFQPLPLDMLEEIKLHTNDEYVFSISSDVINGKMKKAAKELNIPSNINLHVHILRKIFGSNLARNGVSMSMVSKLMRHSDISITQRFYIQYGLDETSEAMNGGHSLIRIAISPEDRIDNFVDKNLNQYFKRDSRFTIKTVRDPQNRTATFTVTY